MHKRWGQGLLAGLLGGLTAMAMAGPLSVDDLPAALKDWLPWALHGQTDAWCPQPHDGQGERACVWPARLDVTAGADGAVVRYEVQVYGGASLVTLPGEHAHWPLDARIGTQPLAVADADGRPTVSLPPGRHVIEARIPWKSMPQDLLLPRGLGVLQLSVDGQTVNRAPDDEGRVWLRQAPDDTQTGGDTQTVHTARWVNDEVPLRVTTRYELAVSGQSREIVLPAALLSGFVPESLNSALPVRLQEGGGLAVQARAGTWTIELQSRLMSPVQALTLPTATASPEEVWVFQAHNDIRLVTVEGVPSVDPRQVQLPDDWRQFPAYRMRPGDTFKLVQSRRGNPEPAPDKLKLTRQIWLDFDGQGYTMRDQLTGELNRANRLELLAPAVLGRVAIDGQDQPVTCLSPQGPMGAEVRAGRARIEADSRLTGAGRDLPATGWAMDIQQAAAVLHLPPGWMLLHVQGVDHAAGAWVSGWTLWDFFFVLLCALAVGRLFGWGSGVLMGVALALTWHMPGAPHGVWLLWLAMVALDQVLPAGRLQVLARWGRWGGAVLLALWLLPYAVDQVRLSLYPVMAQPWREVGEPAREGGTDAAEATDESAVAEAAAPADARRSPYESLSATAPSPKLSRPTVYEIDPRARVQTGPGVPDWRWDSHRLTWQGPVQAAQRLHLWVLPPWATVIWRLLGLALLLAAWWRLVGPRGLWPRDGLVSGQRPAAAPAVATLTLAAVLACGAMAPQGALAAKPASPDAASAPEEPQPPQPPSASLLDELRQRVTAPPDCLPHCADVPRMLVSAAGSRVQLRLEAHALADVSLPLPGQGSHWRPTLVAIDGRPAVTRRDDDGALWVALPRGISQVVLEADVGPVSTVDITLPLPVRQVSTQLQGWSLGGLDGRGMATGSISLSRAAPVGQSTEQGVQRDALPPFVHVERTLHLGLRWTIETRIVRASPSLAPLRVSVPLLAGESVNSEQVEVKDGVAWVALGAEPSTQFSSTLAPAGRLVLTSGKAPNQIESWHLDASTHWHVTHSGLAPVAHQADGRWWPSWRPWPGEQWVLTVTRPDGVPGQTMTVDRIQTHTVPGIRATDVTATWRLRSSQGGNHAVTLPEGAALLSVTLDGQAVPLQAQQGRVMLPITPGAHDVQLTWREPRGMGGWFRTDGLHLGLPGVNDRVQLSVPQDRVVLAVGGAPVGPAVLFWGVLCVIVAVSVGLSRWPLSPLRAASWVLLGLGVAQMSLLALLVVVGWFFAMQARERLGPASRRGWFITHQVLLCVWALVAVSLLLETVRMGLLGYPDLMITGNGSSARELAWFHDRFDGDTLRPWVVSAPLWAYRVVMLLWALWLATALLRWVRWGWGCFSAGGYWPSRVVASVLMPSPPVASPTAPPDEPRA